MQYSHMPVLESCGGNRAMHAYPRILPISIVPKAKWMTQHGTQQAADAQLVAFLGDGCVSALCRLHTLLDCC